MVFALTCYHLERKIKMHLIGETAAITGISQVTLRAWERRYGFPKPSRVSGRLRYYSEHDIALIQRMKVMIQSGWSPAGAARQLQGELSDPNFSESANHSKEKINIFSESALAVTTRQLASNSLDTIVGKQRGLRGTGKNAANRSLILEALNQLMTTLLQSNTKSQMLNDVLQNLVITFKAESGLIFLVNPADSNLTLGAHIGVSSKFVKEAKILQIGTGIAGRVALTGEPLLVENISSDPRLTLTMAREEGFLPLLCYPLISHRRVQGVISLLNRTPRVFTQPDLEMIALLAPHLGQAIEYAQLQEELARHQREQVRAIQRQLTKIATLRQETNRNLAQAIENKIFAPMAGFQNRLKSEQKELPPEIEIALEGVRQVLDKLPESPLPQVGLSQLIQQKLVPWLSNSGNNQLDIRLDNWPTELPDETTIQLYDGIQQLFNGLSQHPDFSNLKFYLTLRATSGHLEVLVQESTSIFEDLREQLIGQNLPEWFLRLRATLHLLGGEVRLEREVLTTQSQLVLSLPRYSDSREEQPHIKIILAEDQPLLRQALANILSTDPRLELVAMAERGLQCLELTRYLQPDILLVDVSLPDLDGSTVTRLFKTENPDGKVILLAAYDNDVVAAQGLEAGASACLLKNVLPNELLQTIHAVYEGHFIFSAGLASKFLVQNRLKQSARAARNLEVTGELNGEETKKRLAQLTERELEVLKGLAQGITGKQLARNLGISDKTLRQHISNIYQKLKIYDRVQLALLALSQL